MAESLVIGVGNRLRGDDAAGLETARRLAECAPAGVRVLEATGDGAELMEAWRGAERVVVVDASQTGSAPATVRRFDAAASPLPARHLRVSSHAFGVAEAIELSRALGTLPRRLEVIAIEGEAFAAGASLSPAVARAAASLAGALACELAAKDPIPGGRSCTNTP